MPHLNLLMLILLGNGKTTTHCGSLCTLAFPYRVRMTDESLKNICLCLVQDTSTATQNSFRTSCFESQVPQLMDIKGQRVSSLAAAVQILNSLYIHNA